MKILAYFIVFLFSAPFRPHYNQKNNELMMLKTDLMKHKQLVKKDRGSYSNQKENYINFRNLYTGFTFFIVLLLC